MDTQAEIALPDLRYRARQKKETRSRILDTALELFAAGGILATTTMDVAASAGVSHGSVFAHFQTRDNLVAVVISNFGHEVVGRLHDLAERKAGVRDTLYAHLKGIEEHEAFYRRLVIEGPLLPDESRNVLIGIQSAVSIHLAEAVDREISEKKLRPMQLALLFNTWIGLMHHYLANRDLFSPGKSVIAEKGDDLLNHYMALLAP